jgi:hypothetical protein
VEQSDSDRCQLDHLVIRAMPVLLDYVRWTTLELSVESDHVSWTTGSLSNCQYERTVSTGLQGHSRTVRKSAPSPLDHSRTVSTQHYSSACLHEHRTVHVYGGRDSKSPHVLCQPLLGYRIKSHFPFASITRSSLKSTH